MVDLAPISESTRTPSTEVTQRLPQILDNYLRYHRIEGSTDSTLIHKKKELGAFVKWLASEGHSLAPEAVTIEDIEGHLAWMQDRGLAINSLHTRLRSIKAWFNWMTKRKRIPENPAQEIKPPRLPKLRKPFVKKEEFEAMLAWCPLNTLLGARRQAMLWLFITTGLRRNELALLRVADLNWDGQALTVLHGKGQKERRAPFSRLAQRPMLRYIEQRELKGFNSEWLWVTEEGVQFQWHGIGRDLKRLQQKAGVQIPDVCHSLRRTFAANAVRQHIPRPFVEAIAGWATGSPMLSRYVAAMEAEDGALLAFEEFTPFA